jgi:macrolide-specific efflux system membrane fusion protein
MNLNMNFKKSPISSLVVILIVIATIGILSSASAKRRRPTNSQLQEFSEARAERGPLVTTVLSTGVVKPENRVEVKPPISGRAEFVLVKEGDKVKKGQTLVWMSSTERAALLDAARAQGPEEFKKWENLYRAAPILAPVDGTIIQRKIEEGQTFSVTDPILVMSDRLIIEAQVDETDLARIQKGQKASVILDAYPKNEIPAQVESIAYEATTVNSITTYVVKVNPLEMPKFMRSGMTANVRFEIASKENVLMIPSNSIRVENGEFAVLIRDLKTGLPVLVPIKVGMGDAKRTEVIEGLDEGAVVLIEKAHAQDENTQTDGSTPFDSTHSSAHQ